MMTLALPLADAQHFVRGPDWTWYILFYFFFAGLSGGSYFLASLFRVAGKPADEPASRLGVYVAFAALLPCPVLLTLDLGQPLRFWHMLVNTTPGELGPVFKYWSPMSVGAWALVAFGLFVTVSFVEALARDRVIRIRLVDWAVRPLDGVLGKLWHLVGGLLGLFIAGYTGVLLAVSNQPVWSDTWVLGGLFLASGLSGSAALLGWLVHRRSDARAECRRVRPVRAVLPVARAGPDRGVRSGADPARRAGPGLCDAVALVLAGRGREPAARSQRVRRRQANRESPRARS